MVGACITHWRSEKCVRNFRRETWKKSCDRPRWRWKTWPKLVFLYKIRWEDAESIFSSVWGH